MRNQLIFLSIAAPETAEYYIKQINILLSVPKPSFEKILQLANDGLARHPENINLLVAKSAMHYQLGEYSEEEAVLRKALTLLPNDAPLLFRLGDCIQRQGSINERAEEILWFFERAVEKDPTNPIYQNAQGVALLSLDRPKEASYVFQSALEEKPDVVTLRFSCGIARLQSGLNDETTRDHLKYAWNHNLHPAGYALAASFLLAGQKKEADEILSFAMLCDDGANYNIFLGFEDENSRTQENWQPH